MTLIGRLALLALVGLGPAEQAVAQSTAADRVRAAAEKLADPDARVGIWLGSVFPGGGASAGPRVQTGQGPWGRLSLSAGVSVRGGVSGELRWRRAAAGSRVTTSVWVQSQRAKGLKQYVDTGTTLLATSFDFTQHVAMAAVAFTLTPAVTVTATTGYRRLSLGRAHEYLDSSLVVRGDWRPDDDPESRGSVVRAGFHSRHALRSSTVSFDQIEAEGAHLLAMNRLRSVAAVRVIATTTLSGATSLIPFVLLPEVGSGSTLRSFPHGRFRDRSRLVVSGEYRWRPSGRIELAAFVDHGASSHSLGEIGNEGFLTSVGLGVRVRVRNVTRGRIDVAHGREGWRVVLASGQAF